MTIATAIQNAILVTAIQNARIQAQHMANRWWALCWNVAQTEDEHYRAKEMADLWTLVEMELKRRGRRHDDSLVARPDIARVAEALIRTQLGE